MKKLLLIILSITLFIVSCGGNKSEEKKLEKYQVFDSENITKWGLLQYFEKINKNTATEAERKERAEKMLKYYKNSRIFRQVLFKQILKTQKQKKLRKLHNQKYQTMKIK